MTAKRFLEEFLNFLKIFDSITSFEDQGQKCSDWMGHFNKYAHNSSQIMSRWALYSKIVKGT